jgi:uncharacterized protein
MKLHLTHADGNQLITAYEVGQVSINKQPYTQSLIVLPTKILNNWLANDFDSLTEAHFNQLSDLNPEVVILGTGQKHRFIHPKLTSSLTQKGIPVECMTTDAACRTYNILMSEGRLVAAALIL